MASSRYLISSQTLSSSTANVTFSSIPATYTDLVVRVSARSDVASGNGMIGIRFNLDNNPNYSETYIYGTGATSVSGRVSGASGGKIGQSGYLVADSASNTASTFGSLEVYIPSYAASITKPVSATAVEESNSASTDTYISSFAALWNSTAAITTIRLSDLGGSFISGSSFYLYGIKNS